MKFKVKVQEINEATYEIEAASHDEAVERVLDGEGDLLYTEYVRSTGETFCYLDGVLAETGCQNEEHIMAASAAVDVLGGLLPD